MRFLRSRNRQVCYLSLFFWAFGTILPCCSVATTAAKLMLATLLETVASRLPTNKRNVVDDISGQVAGSPGMVQVLTGEAAWWWSSRRCTCLCPRASPEFSSTAQASSNRDFCGSWRCWGSTGATRHATWGADLQLGTRRRALVVKGCLARASKRTKRTRQLRKAGHTLATSPSLARMLGRRSEPSESTRLKPPVGPGIDRTRPQP